MFSTNDSNLNSTSTTDISDPIPLPGAEMALLAVSLLIEVTGLLGNAFVVFVILKTKSLRERLPNQFIVNQSVIDFCSCVSLIASALPKKASLTMTLADSLYCKLYLSNAFSWGLVFSSTYSLIALTIERYLSIVHPVWHKTWCRKAHAHVVMSVTWLLGMVEGVAHAVPTSYIEDGVCYTFSRWPSDWARIVAGLLTCSLHYIMPMAVLVFCYGKMILVITGRIKKVAPLPPTDRAIAVSRINDININHAEQPMKIENIDHPGQSQPINNENTNHPGQSKSMDIENINHQGQSRSQHMNLNNINDPGQSQPINNKNINSSGQSESVNIENINYPEQSQRINNKNITHPGLSQPIIYPKTNYGGNPQTNNGKQDQLWNKAKRNVIHALMLVSFLFAVCWSMNQVYYLMMCLGYPPDFTSTFYNITVLAIYLNSSVNPIVYFVKYEQFKMAASRILRLK